MKPYHQENGITIYHGDCREVLPEIEGNACVFDPPYGIGRNYGAAYDDKQDGYWDWFLPALEPGYSI
jgi:DNA modification methylase